MKHYHNKHTNRPLIVNHKGAAKKKATKKFVTVNVDLGELMEKHSEQVAKLMAERCETIRVNRTPIAGYSDGILYMAPETIMSMSSRRKAGKLENKFDPYAPIRIPRWLKNAEMYRDLDGYVAE
jgi:hypothetical protein